MQCVYPVANDKDDYYWKGFRPGTTRDAPILLPGAWERHDSELVIATRSCAIDIKEVSYLPYLRACLRSGRFHPATGRQAFLAGEIYILTWIPLRVV